MASHLMLIPKIFQHYLEVLDKLLLRFLPGQWSSQTAELVLQPQGDWLSNTLAKWNKDE